MEWFGVVWSGVVWSFGAYKSKFLFSSLDISTVLEFIMIQKKTHKIDIFRVNSGFFDTKLKILTPAPHVVHVTNIRYAIRFTFL